jgi:hypothetical protein
MSVVAVLAVGWGAYSVLSWLLDDPHAITRYRDPRSGAYTITKIYEAVILAGAIAIAAFVIRGVRRERRFTFDAQLCVAGGLAFWIDPLYNFFVPTVAYSSNFVNVGNWCGHTPLVLNKACGDSPEPVMIGLVYLFGFLGCALIGGAVLRFLTRRFPTMSIARRLGLCGLVGVAFDIPFDMVAPRVHLWNEFAPPAITMWDSSHRFPLTILISGLVFFGAPVIIRYVRDDAGRTIFERGLEHLPPWGRAALAFVSLVGFMQLVCLFVVVVTIAPLGLYANSTPTYPPYIINGTCDNGTIQGTAYGPCPGTPRFRAPLGYLPHHARP